MFDGEVADLLGDFFGEDGALAAALGDAGGEDGEEDGFGGDHNAGTM